MDLWWGYYDDENEIAQDEWNYFLENNYKTDNTNDNESAFINDQNKYVKLMEHINEDLGPRSHPFFTIPSLCLCALKIVNNYDQYKLLSKKISVSSIELTIPDDFPDELLDVAIEHTDLEKLMERLSFDDPNKRKNVLDNQICIFTRKVISPENVVDLSLINVK